MSERDWKYDMVRVGPITGALLILALPLIFIIATIGSAFSMIFSKKK